MATGYNKPLIVIAGPTASGKTGLAIDLAKELDGEIVCADSRTVFKGMDIGTAKPTKKEQAIVPHWGLDLVEPNERFTAADFKKYALATIADIRAQGKTPLLVGGTGLYVDGIIFDFEYDAAYDASLREKLDGMSVDKLIMYCKNNSILLPKNERNKRHLVRAIEQKSINTKRRDAPIENCIIVGIATNKRELNKRIEARGEQLFENGVVAEATMLGKKYGWESEAMTGNIYPIVQSYLKNELTLVEAIDLFTTSDQQLAKRQMTWFRRNPYIEWVSLTEAKDYIYTVLAHE